MSADEDYLKRYPHFRKWINQCVCCQTMGLKPEMPQDVGQAIYNDSTQETFYGVGAKKLRRMFKPLPLNEQGLCEQCAANTPQKHH